MATQGNDLNKAMTTQANDLLANDLNKPMTTKGNGLQLIACESCGVEVKQRTVWQRFCPTCSAERKKGVLRAKAKAVKKS
jgi:protein-arginine kinase activator protein McsA